MQPTCREGGNVDADFDFVDGEFGTELDKGRVDAGARGRAILGL